MADRCVQSALSNINFIQIYSAFDTAGADYTATAIMNMRQRSGSTATANGIKYVREHVLTQSGNRLNSNDTATIVLVVTDGGCNIE